MADLRWIVGLRGAEPDQGAFSHQFRFFVDDEVAEVLDELGSQALLQILAGHQCSDFVGDHSSPLLASGNT